MRGAPRRRSRREPLDRPARAVAPVAEAVVEPVIAVLPELVRLGSDDEAAPDLRTRHRSRRVSLLQLLDGLLELAPARYDLALVRRARRQLRPVRPRGEVRVRVGERHARDGPLDPN